MPTYHSPVPVWLIPAAYSNLKWLTCVLAPGAGGRTESALDWARRRGDTAALQLLGAPGAPAQPICQTELVRLHPRSPRESFAKALPLLVASGPTFVKKLGFVSCHRQSLPLLPYSLGRAKGVSRDETVARRTTLAVLSVKREIKVPLGPVLRSSLTRRRRFAVSTSQHWWLELNGADQFPPLKPPFDCDGLDD